MEIFFLRKIIAFIFRASFVLCQPHHGTVIGNRISKPLGGGPTLSLLSRSSTQSTAFVVSKLDDRMSPGYQITRCTVTLTTIDHRAAYDREKANPEKFQTKTRKIEKKISNLKWSDFFLRFYNYGRTTRTSPRSERRDCLGILRRRYEIVRLIFTSGRSVKVGRRVRRCTAINDCRRTEDPGGAHRDGAFKEVIGKWALTARLSPPFLGIPVEVIGKSSAISLPPRSSASKRRMKTTRGFKSLRTVFSR